jgi:hypothetical protein
MSYFGLGLVWLKVLGPVSGSSNNELFKIWIGASLLGMFIYLGIAKMRAAKGAHKGQ